jgi:hypothetical protein
MKNLIIVLEGIGLNLKNVAFFEIYLLHFDEDYSMMNAVYATYFDADKRCYMYMFMYICICMYIFMYPFMYISIYVYKYVYI